MKNFWNWIRTGWQGVLFSIIGFVLLWFCLERLQAEDVTGAAAVFGMAFLSFLYANLSRFKRFKGLGFEAELWEDKQKEAESLIQRLSEIVAIYSREVIHTKIRANRWGSTWGWPDHWRLYREIETQHKALGISVNLSGVKAEMDALFLFDATQVETEVLNKAIQRSRASARQVLDKEFPSPISDHEGYNRRNLPLRNLPNMPQDPSKIAKEGDLAQSVLEVWEENKRVLAEEYGVVVDDQITAIERLQELSRLFQSRPLDVTDEMISWVGNRD